MLYIGDESMFIRKGDSGNIIIGGIPTDKTYTVYFSLVDENMKIVKEWSQSSLGLDTITLSFPASDIDGIKVGDYECGVKLCADGMEDTVLPYTEIVDGKIVQYPAPIITVGDKYAEGTTSA